MTNVLEKISNLNNLVLQGKALEAFEKYYHTDVVMQENDSQPTVGKQANLQREKEFYSSVTEFREAKPLKVTVNGSYSMVEWFYDYTHKDWGVRKYTQVSVQEWKDGKIIKEKFYYS